MLAAYLPKTTLFLLFIAAKQIIGSFRGMKNKSLIIIILLLYLLLYSSCTKIKNSKPIYEGNWVSGSSSYNFFITITSSGYGTYYTIGTNGIDNKNNPYKGEARIDWSHKHIYIGATKFKIIDAPYIYTTLPDTINVLGQEYPTEGMKMKLENSVFQGNEVITFFKVKE